MRLTITILVFVCMFAAVVSATGNNRSADSIAVAKATLYNSCLTASQDSIRCKKFVDTRFYRMTSIGVPLVVGGVVAQQADLHVRSMRNRYMPRFRSHIDDYMQYAPAAVMLGLKVGGVKSRHSWGRMLVSDLFAVGLMTGTVNAMKYTVRTRRPDGSSRNSFPSGHTATAFMTATMLTKEYGYKSPWVGIGAYAVASVTGLMRVANNRHWLSDVLTGAGIGILTTELGYFFADLIFEDKGIEHLMDDEMAYGMDCPLFLGASMGAHIPLNNYYIDNRNSFIAKCGIAASVEGVYLFRPYVGVGGRLSVADVRIFTRDSSEQSSFDIFSYCGGCYFSWPLSSRMLVGSKVMCGYAHYSSVQIQSFTISGRDGFCIGGGVSLTYRLRPHCGVRLFVDYNLFSPYIATSNRYMNTLTCGASIGMML